MCDKEEILEVEITRLNVQKHLQVDNTPLQQEPLCSHFGEQGNFKNGIGYYTEIYSSHWTLQWRRAKSSGLIIFSHFQLAQMPTDWTGDKNIVTW